MNRVYTLYYLLIVCLILGTFAAMAQNHYGQIVLGLVAFGFGLIFSYHTWCQIRLKNNSFWSVAEPIGLGLLSVILGLRVFYIYFPYAEIIFIVAGSLLVLIYLRMCIVRNKITEDEHPLWYKFDLFYYGSIVLFLCALILAPFFYSVSFIAGAVAFILLAIFIGMTYYNRTLSWRGEVINPLYWLRIKQDHSTILLIVFILFSFYQAMIRTSVFPAMYNDEMPQVYYELIQKKSSRLIQSDGHTWDYNTFKAAYDQLVERHPAKNR